MAAIGSASVDDEESSYKTVYGEKNSKQQFLSIPINGVIIGQRSEIPDPFAFLEAGITYGYDVKEELRIAADNKSIKGVILEVNSPGGTIYGSHAIADGVAYYKAKTNNPVITHIGGLAASGGYWASVSSDYVTADYGSTIGSIGVIFGPFKYYDTVVSEDGGAFVGGIVTQQGIETTYFTAGKSKDLGNPYRRLSTDEIRVMQQSVNNEYDAFVQYVSKRRTLTSDKIRNQIGALVYDNKSAMQLGLIDATMSKEDAYRVLANKSSIGTSDYQIVQPRSGTGFFESLSEIMSQRKQPIVSTCPLTTLILAYHGPTSSLCQ